MGILEILLIFLCIVIFFGAEKIPSLARSFGSFIRQVKDASNEIKREIQQEDKD
tara:strand:+ start:416 stop:577 length:162 start_codon:yes stop_codon:yes gene_type:complete